MSASVHGGLATKQIKALAIAGGDTGGAIAYAEGCGGSWHEVVDSLRLRAAVASNGTDDFGLPTPDGHDFSEFIRPLSIIGKLVGLRRVPSRTRVIAATAGSSAYWAGERQARPISRATLTGTTLELLSIISMLVTTKELVRSSSPGAESILSADLARAAVQAMDEAFVGHANAGIAGVKPASITYGTTPIHSTGNALADIDADLALMIQRLSDAGSNLSMATFVLRPRTALYLARLRGSGGALAHPLMTVKGGVLLGLPAITSASVPLDDIGSPVTGFSQITLLDPSEILVADDGGSSIELSEQAALQMVDSTVAGAQSMVSMFQTESVALKITRYANWQRCRDGVAVVLDQVAY